MPENSNPPSKPVYFWTLNAVFGAVFICDIAVRRNLSVLDSALLVLAVLNCIVALNRQLPLQNVLAAAFVTLLAGGAAHAWSGRMGFPFGPLAFDVPTGTEAELLSRKTEITLNPLANQNPGQFLLFGLLPWMIPLLWVVVIFTARGTARLILRPWRKVKSYGFRLIGLTVFLSVTFDFAMEPYAVKFKHWWHWQHTKIGFTWQGATFVNFLGWACVSLLIMMFITPFLIRKQPGSRRVPDVHPLVLWLGALLLFAIGSAEVGLWPVVAADVVIAGVTATFAIRGLKW